MEVRIAIERLMVTVTGRSVPPGGGGHARICGPEEILAESARTGVLTATVELGRVPWLRPALWRGRGA